MAELNIPHLHGLSAGRRYDVRERPYCELCWVMDGGCTQSAGRTTSALLVVITFVQLP